LEAPHSAMVAEKDTVSHGLRVLRSNTPSSGIRINVVCPGTIDLRIRSQTP